MLHYITVSISYSTSLHFPPVVLERTTQSKKTVLFTQPVTLSLFKERAPGRLMRITLLKIFFFFFRNIFSFVFSNCNAVRTGLLVYIYIYLSLIPHHAYVTTSEPFQLWGLHPHFSIMCFNNTILIYQRQRSILLGQAHII